MENILSHGVSIAQIATFIGFVLTLVCGVVVAIYTIRAGQQQKHEDAERKARDDEYAEFKLLVFKKFDEIYDCLGKDGKDFSELKGAFEMYLKLCGKNHD
jgi:hypothetical protein